MTEPREEQPIDAGTLLKMAEVHMAAFIETLTDQERVRLYLAARAVYGDVVNAVERKIGKRLPVVRTRP